MEIGKIQLERQPEKVQEEEPDITEVNIRIFLLMGQWLGLCGTLQAKYYLVHQDWVDFLDKLRFHHTSKKKRNGETGDPY